MQPATLIIRKGGRRFAFWLIFSYWAIGTLLGHWVCALAPGRFHASLL